MIPNEIHFKKSMKANYNILKAENLSNLVPITFLV